MISDIASELRKLHELSFTYFPHPDAQEHQTLFWRRKVFIEYSLL